jgi:PAS domain S-box-containing protein
MTADQHSDRERRLFELVRDVLIIATPDGTILRVNRAACDLAGLREDEIVGRNLLELTRRADRDMVAARLAGLAAEDTTAEAATLRIVRPDGRERSVEFEWTHDIEARALYMVGRDVTDREDGYMDRLAAAFRDAPLGMALVAPDGRFLRANSTLCSLLGLRFDEILERRLPDLVDDPRFAASLRGSESSVQVETGMRHSEGREVVALLSATLVRNNRGEAEYFVCQVLDMTERYAYQEALAASRAKLAEAQAVARLGSWEWDIASDTVTWSDELYRIYGVRPEDREADESSYDSYLDQIHPEDRVRVARVIETAVAERRPWSLDYRIVRPDGEQRMIHARGEVVTGEDDRPAVVHGTCQDVTESRRVEDALRAAEQLFRRAFDDAPVGMALIDLEGRWLRLNRSLCRILGRSEQELRAMHPDDLSHPADTYLDRPLIEELLAGRRRSYAIERRYVRADGTHLDALVHVSLMHGDGERPLYFLCQLVDLSERRRAEAERRAGEQRLQAIIDNSPALIIVKDLQGRYQLVNRRWEELFGVRAEEAIGRTSHDVLPDTRRPDTEAIDGLVVREDRTYESLLAIRDADGEGERTFLTVKFPMRDAEGRATGVVTIATDMTERRRSAEERAELERRLAQVQRLESVGQLAGGVAHDFNNLLSVILTCVGFAERELPAEHPVRADVEEIGHAADRAAALTRQLLMFSRREVVTPEVIDVGAMVRDLERLLTRTLSERIALLISIGPDLPTVLADRARLEQVLINLAVNARDAMPDGGTLTIAVDEHDGRVRITVSDDGAGMLEEVRERAFEPFFTTKAPGEGTGLGLATVHGIVTDSGGSVELSSEPGEGTVVTVLLPGCDEEIYEPEAPPGLGERALGTARVLVVEDQESVRRQACRILAAHGYEVHDASGAEQALADWRPVDVLVTDVVMPGMSGLELARSAGERTPDLRVVYMSGHTEDTVVHDGARTRNLSYLQKPFTRASLLRAVEDALAAAPPELTAER